MPLVVFYEERPSFEHGRVRWIPLTEVEGYEAFMEATAHINPDIYLLDVRRFAHKAFAQLGALELFDVPIWWLDADLVFKAPVPDSLWEMSGAVVHMGRSGTHTESGVVGFNPAHPDFKEFHERYARQYRQREILFLHGWTDCHALDYSIQGLEVTNLTPEGKGVENVIEQSRFGPYMDHLKGRRKFEAVSTAA